MSISDLTPSFKLSIEKNRYYVVEVFDNDDFTIEDLKKIVQVQNELGGIKLPVLVLCSPNTTGDVSMLNYLAKNENNPNSKADAFVINSLAQKIIGSFYVKLISPERPTKMFTNKEDALIWLKQFE